MAGFFLAKVQFYFEGPLISVLRAKNTADTRRKSFYSRIKLPCFQADIEYYTIDSSANFFRQSISGCLPLAEREAAAVVPLRRRRIRTATSSSSSATATAELAPQNEDSPSAEEKASFWRRRGGGRRGDRNGGGSGRRRAGEGRREVDVLRKNVDFRRN